VLIVVEESLKRSEAVKSSDGGKLGRFGRTVLS
jgi:hypothetical protein